MKVARNIQNICVTLVDGAFTELRNLIKTFDHMTDTFKTKLKYIDAHIGEYLDAIFTKLGQGLDILKSKLNNLAKIYQSYASKYSGGSRKVFTRKIIFIAS